MASNAARAAATGSILALALTGCGTADRTVADEAYLRQALGQSVFGERATQVIGANVTDPELRATQAAIGEQRRAQAAELRKIAGDDQPVESLVELDAKALELPVDALQVASSPATRRSSSSPEERVSVMLSESLAVTQATDAAALRVVTLPELRAFARHRAASDRALLRRLRASLPAAAARK